MMTEEVTNRLFEKLDSQVDKISFLTETVGVMSNQLTDLHKCVRGNGKPGLVDQFSALKDTLAEHKQNDFKIRLLLGAGIVMVGAGGMTSGVMFFDMLKKIFFGM